MPSKAIDDLLKSVLTGDEQEEPVSEQPVEEPQGPRNLVPEEPGVWVPDDGSPPMYINPDEEQDTYELAEELGRDQDGEDAESPEEQSLVEQAMELAAQAHADYAAASSEEPPVTATDAVAEPVAAEVAEEIILKAPDAGPTCSECHNPLTEENAWSGGTCEPCAEKLGLKEPLRPLPTFFTEEPVSLWKVHVKALKALVDEVPLQFTQDGNLLIKTVDPAHVAMVVATLPLWELDRKDWEFGTADDAQTGEAPYAMDIIAIRDFLKGLKVNDTVKLAFEEAKPGEGQFVLTSGFLEKRFPMRDASGFSTPKIPNLDYTAHVEIGAGDFKKAVQAMGEVSDHVVLTARPNREFVVSSGWARGEYGQSRLNETQKEAVFDMSRAISVRAKEEVRSVYPLDYLAKMVAPFAKETLKLSYAEDYPLRVDVDLDSGHYTWLLAPRIEST